MSKFSRQLVWFLIAFVGLSLSAGPAAAMDCDTVIHAMGGHMHEDSHMPSHQDCHCVEQIVGLHARCGVKQKDDASMSSKTPHPDAWLAVALDAGHAPYPSTKKFIPTKQFWGDSSSGECPIYLVKQAILC